MSSSLLFPIKSNVFLKGRFVQNSFFKFKYFALFFLTFFSFFSNAQSNLRSGNKLSQIVKNIIPISKEQTIFISVDTIQEIDQPQILKGSEKISVPIMILYVLVFIAIVVFLVVYRKRSNVVLSTKYKDFINNIKTKQKIEMPDFSHIPDDDTPKEPLRNIPDEAFNVILKKIIRFENSDKYLRKDINLTWLSNHLNTNTKYLSEVIKIHRNKSFNNYINGLRIEYITRKLYENPVYREYKITYLAEECGYASPQVFVIAFKKEIGVTPSYFVEQLKNQED